ncbi:MAG: folylpolyglutamate synthase/dihydrofolate synthase family protein [Hyphomonadaceae bacterium]
MTIVPFPKFGAGIGLHRVRAISQALGLDLAAFGARACVVTGSNGKGSVAAMAAAILAEAEADVGLFTSPHLLALNERFAIDGDAIDDASLERHWARVLAACEAYERMHPDDRVGGFEFLFLIAASWFSEQRCAFTVWEAGIGGRYDPVRLIAAPRAALVSLDLEHTALLGETLEQIAYDKSEACAEGGTLFIGAITAELERRLEAYCALRRVRARFVRQWRAGKDGAIEIELDGARLRVRAPLSGPHQRNNTAVAVELAYDMLRKSGLAHARACAAIEAGLAATRWPGRLEAIEEKPPIVIDVGHTPAAIVSARAGFCASHRPCVLVCGASHDKAAEDMIAALAPDFRVIVCAQANHKGRPAAEIAALARRFNEAAEIIVADSIADARRTALHRAEALHGAIYVAGGLFLAAEFKAAHLGLDPRGLRFF